MVPRKSEASEARVSSHRISPRCFFLFSLGKRYSYETLLFIGVFFGEYLYEVDAMTPYRHILVRLGRHPLRRISYYPNTEDTTRKWLLSVVDTTKYTICTTTAVSTDAAVKSKKQMKTDGH